MLDFETELEKLLSREVGPLPQHEFAEVAAVERHLLVELDRKQRDASLQIEEIYDLVKEQRVLIEAAERERQEKDRLVTAAVEIADLIEYFRAYAERSGDEALQAQAGAMWQNTVKILANCGVVRFGEAGEPLDPRAHTVKASAESSFPYEYVTEVLQSGYMSQDRILRKAAVVVSRGQGDAKSAGSADVAGDGTGDGDGSGAGARP
jgi:molecular chaperone GrpE (heat shock protein)